MLKVGIEVGIIPLMTGGGMARALNRLTVRQVQTLKDVGRHSDGGGLYLRVTPKGGRSWVFMTKLGVTRIEVGLGAASSLSLAKAREIATKMRETSAVGQDPRTILVGPEPADIVQIPTFGTFSNIYISGVEQGWRNEVHRQQWRNSLRDHAASLCDLPISAIEVEDVLTVLHPIWLSQSETAKRVRGRIEKILDAAKVKKLRPRDAINPASWRGNLEHLLPKQPKLTRGHHPALPWKEAPAFITKLQQREAIAARCLEFVIFTAARSGEALGARWSEIDVQAKLWTIPANRMKAGNEHVVPLSEAALSLLDTVKPKRLEADDLIFSVGGAARSNMAMSMLLRRMSYGHITTHGFRSTFRDWAGDAANVPRELVEQALAHTIQSKSERAYRRGTAVERRRELMEAWASYVLSASK